MDAVYSILTSSGKAILPQRNDEIEEFVKELTSSLRVIEEDESGGRRYVWRQTGPDHYFHSFGYCLLASSRIGLMESDDEYLRRKFNLDYEIPEQPAYRPFDYGLTPSTKRGSYDPSSYGLSGDDYDPNSWNG